jgi:MFS family permease
MAAQGQRRGVPGVLNGVALVAFLDTFAMLPVLAPYAHRLGASEAEAGFLLGAYSLANLLASAGSGMLLDRLGRRLPMALSLIVAAALIALYGVVSSPEMLLLVRSLHGASSAVFIPAMFVLIGEHGHANRVWAMGRTGAIIGLVALIAPPLGGMVADRYGERALFMGIALLMGFTGMIAWLGLPAESYRPPRGESIHPLQVLRLPTLWSNFLLTFGLTFGMGMLTYRLPVMLQQAGYDAAYRGRLFGLFALMAIGVMLAVRRRAVLGGARARAMLGLGLIAVGSVMLEGWSLPSGAWSAVLLFGVGFGLGFPAVHLLTYEGVEAHQRGTAFALLYAFYSLGYVLGPTSAGLAAERFPAGLVAALVVGVSLLVALGMGWRQGYTRSGECSRMA